MSFVDIEKADRVLRILLEWALMKRGIPEVFGESMKSLYEGAKAEVSVDYELSEVYEVRVDLQKGYVLSPFLFSKVQLW